MTEKKNIDVRFYAEPGQDGATEPVRDWLRELPEDERIAVGADIRIVQNHWPKVQDVKPKLIDHIKDDIWEVRTSAKDHWLRVFFGFLNSKMILLHAIKKKTNETPEKDVKLAIKRFSKLKQHNSKP